MTQQPAKRRNAAIAAVTGAILLVGGSTYALWSASDGLAGGSITAGNLDIAALATNAWDVSSDRSDGTDPVVTAETAELAEDGITLEDMTGHLIDDLANWRMVPGDTVALTFPYEVTLLGDNLVASLTMPGVPSLVSASDFGGGSKVVSDLTYEYQMFDATGASLGDRAPLGTSDFISSYYQASNEGQSGGVVDGDGTVIPIIDVDATNGNSAVVVFVLYVTFDSASADQGQEDTGSVLTLASSVTATLTQVRCTPDTAESNFPVCQVQT